MKPLKTNPILFQAFPALWRKTPKRKSALGHTWSHSRLKWCLYSGHLLLKPYRLVYRIYKQNINLDRALDNIGVGRDFQKNIVLKQCEGRNKEDIAGDRPRTHTLSLYYWGNRLRNFSCTNHLSCGHGRMPRHFILTLDVNLENTIVSDHHLNLHVSILN